MAYKFFGKVVVSVDWTKGNGNWASHTSLYADGHDTTMSVIYRVTSLLSSMLLFVKLDLSSCQAWYVTLLEVSLDGVFVTEA